MIDMTKMMKIFLVLLIGLLVVQTGCRTRSGSREFIPGKGWVPND